MVKNPLAMQETGIQALVRKIPWRREWPPTPVLPGKSHGQRSLEGYSPWDCRVGHDSMTDTFHLILMTMRHFVKNRQNICKASGTIIEATGEFENIH